MVNQIGGFSMEIAGFRMAADNGGGGRRWEVWTSSRSSGTEEDATASITLKKNNAILILQIRLG